MTAYYNEFDPYCAQWLRNLIDAGHIPPGDVDERSITEVKADEIKEYDQWHFFAGLGGWGYAARLAGIGETSGVLTGSPPCQPFSSAGKRQGYADERHLAPVWLDLVAALRPAWVFGEQVAAAIKKDDWLDDLLDELEGEGYATGAVVLPACGVGAPHIRQRLWVVAQRMADTNSIRQSRQREVGRFSNPAPKGDREKHRVEHDGWGIRLADSNDSQCKGTRLPSRVESQNARSWDSGALVGLAEACDPERDQRGEAETGRRGLQHAPDHCEASQRPGQAETGWDDPDWLYCRDGKWRPVESGTFPAG